MTINFKKLIPFGAEIVNLEPGKLTSSDRDSLYQGLLEYGILVIRGLLISPNTHIELTRIFGEPQNHPVISSRHPEYPEIMVIRREPPKDISNSSDNAERIIGELEWHSDLMYLPVPSRGALLYAIESPPEGDRTGWINTSLVFESLSPEMKVKVRKLDVIHSFEGAKKLNLKLNQEDFQPVIHSLVYQHPETGKQVLNLSSQSAEKIKSLSEIESNELLSELNKFATSGDFTYVHEWKAGDMVIWDNWCTMHRAFGHKEKYRRVMHRTTVKGDDRFKGKFAIEPEKIS